MPPRKCADQWRSYSQDPLNRNVREFIQTSVANALSGVVNDPDVFLNQFVKNYEVLDIGVVEHDAVHMSSPDWKHAKVVKWAASCLGIDILQDEIELLRKRGFNVEVADATSRQFIGRRFDRIVIGDVIEHVDDPVKLLEFARRHLKLDGKILVTTPNPYWILFWAESMRNGTYIANADHVRWVIPTMALELARRSRLNLSAYWLYQPKGNKAWKRIFNLVSRALAPRSELFTHSFYFVFSRQLKKDSDEFFGSSR